MLACSGSDLPTRLAPYVLGQETVVNADLVL